MEVMEASRLNMPVEGPVTAASGNQYERHPFDLTLNLSVSRQAPGWLFPASRPSRAA